MLERAAGRQSLELAVDTRLASCASPSPSGAAWPAGPSMARDGAGSVGGPLPHARTQHWQRGAPWQRQHASWAQAGCTCGSEFPEPMPRHGSALAPLRKPCVLRHAGVRWRWSRLSLHGAGRCGRSGRAAHPHCTHRTAHTPRGTLRCAAEQQAAKPAEATQGSYVEATSGGRAPQMPARRSGSASACRRLAAPLHGLRFALLLLTCARTVYGAQPCFPPRAATPLLPRHTRCAVPPVRRMHLLRWGGGLWP